MGGYWYFFYGDLLEEKDQAIAEKESALQELHSAAASERSQFEDAVADLREKLESKPGETPRERSGGSTAAR